MVKAPFIFFPLQLFQFRPEILAGLLSAILSAWSGGNWPVASYYGSGKRESERGRKKKNKGRRGCPCSISHSEQCSSQYLQNYILLMFNTDAQARTKYCN